MGLDDSPPKTMEKVFGQDVVGGGLEVGLQDNFLGLDDKPRRSLKCISNLKNKTLDVLAKDPIVSGDENDFGFKTVAIEDSLVQDLPNVV